MDEEPRRRKKNFLSGLFRRRSDAPKGERNGKLVRMSLAFFFLALEKVKSFASLVSLHLYFTPPSLT